ncbi:MAG TPA: cadmium resistance transporter [Coleofasciculaceae cyanobacterium]|jgi:cadmium resistance transport/sequestration family protein
MSGLLTAITTGVTAFVATNIDDLVILLLFFAQVNSAFRRRHIVVGQYLGFAALVIASLPGFLGSLVLSHRWIGLLGLIPIAIGLSRLLNRDGEEFQVEEEITQSEPSSIASFISPQTYTVAAITVANGSDNIGIYVPLFASSNLVNLLVIIGVFFLLVGVWCYAAYKLTSQSAIAHLLTHYGNTAVPFVLIGLGVFIVLDSHSLTPQALLITCLCLMGIVKNYEDSSEVVKN